MYKELQDKKQNALLLSLREQQDLYMAAANKKGVLKLTDNTFEALIIPQILFRFGFNQLFNRLIHQSHIILYPACA
jgi:hypothetical protein